MEYLDIVDLQGNPTKEIIERKEAHRLGVCHRTAHIWIVNGNKVLLQKRSLQKESFPGMYDTSSAGHISAGQEPLEAALRELQEELSIQANEEELLYVGTFHNIYEMFFHDRLFKDNEVTFLYLYTKPVDISSLKLQKEELDSVEWFEIDTLVTLLDNKDPRFCVPKKGFELVQKALKKKI